MYPLVLSAVLLTPGADLPSNASLGETKPPSGFPIGPFAARTRYDIYVRAFDNQNQLVADISIKGFGGETAAQETVRSLRQCGIVAYSHGSTLYLVCGKNGERIESAEVRCHLREPSEK